MARRILEKEIQQNKKVLGKDPVKTFTKVQQVKDIKVQDQRQGVFSLKFTYEGDSFAVGYGNGAVDLLDATTGKLIKNVRSARYGGFQIMCLVFNPLKLGLLYATTSGGDVNMCDSNRDTPTNTSIICSEENNEINCLDFSNDGFYFATAGKDLGVRVYDNKTSKLVSYWAGANVHAVLKTDTIKQNTMRVFALRFHPNLDNMFITAGWDNQVKIWDARSRDGIQRSFAGPHVCGDGVDMRGGEILTGSWTGTKALQRWNYCDGSLTKTIQFPCTDNGEFLYCAQYCDNNVVLAGGSGTNSIEAINMETDQHLGGIHMTKPVNAMDSTFGGRLFVAGGQSGLLKIAALT